MDFGLTEEQRAIQDTARKFARERIAQAELLEALRICRQRLAPELRWIVEMHYDEEISQRRIAASLALSTDAVHRRLRRGLHFLHDCLRARGIRP